MLWVTNHGQTIKYVLQYALLHKLHLIILFLPLEGDAVFTNNYPMYVHNFIQFICLPVLYLLPFHTSIILKISIYGMRNFNRPVCYRYKDRSVEVVVSQYLIAHSENKSKDTCWSWTLLTFIETSGWIIEPAMIRSSRLQPWFRCTCSYTASYHIATYICITSGMQNSIYVAN